MSQLTIWRYPVYCDESEDESETTETGIEGVDFFRIPQRVKTFAGWKVVDDSDFKPLPLRRSGRKTVNEMLAYFNLEIPVVPAIEIPLKFWFGGQNLSPEEAMHAYPTYDSIYTKLNDLVNLSLEALLIFETEFEEFRQYYIDKMGLRHRVAWPPRPVFGDELDKIVARKRELQMAADPLIYKYYNYAIELSETETMNGYELYKNEVPFMNYDSYVKIIQESYESQDDDKTFREWLEEQCCSDWAKQDRHGDCYGGFWEYPDGSYEKENAYMLSREDNINGMLELPFPRSILKWSVIQGCGNRMESVRYSNFIGTWFERTKNMLLTGMSLQDLCKHELAKHKVVLPEHLLFFVGFVTLGKNTFKQISLIEIELNIR